MLTAAREASKWSGTDQNEIFIDFLNKKPLNNLYLLSENEVEMYLGNHKTASATKHAEKKYVLAEYEGKVCWLIANSSKFVSFNNTVTEDRVININNKMYFLTNVGIRPAIWVDLKEKQDN